MSGSTTSFLRVVATAAAEPGPCVGKCNVYRCTCTALTSVPSTATAICAGCSHGRMYHSPIVAHDERQLPTATLHQSKPDMLVMVKQLEVVDELEKRAMMKLAKARRTQSDTTGGLQEAFVMLVRALEVLSELRGASVEGSSMLSGDGGVDDSTVLLLRMQVIMQHCDAVKAAMESLSLRQEAAECSNCRELFTGNFCQCCGHKASEGA